MNVKIKSTDVWCLLGEKYDQVYAALRKQLGQEDQQLFAERKPGHEYLQWELPGDDWTALGTGDPLVEQLVREQLSERRKSISLLFGANADMAQRVLSVPAESYVYYKMTDGGRLLIRLTVWGYRNPDRVVPIGNAVSIGLPEKKEQVVVTLTYDGKPCPGKAVRLNDLPRATNLEGQLVLGELPVGYEFVLDIDGRLRSIVVEEGRGNLTIDLTSYTSAQVVVLRDEQPVGDVQVSVSYMGHQWQAATDAAGQTTFKVPLDPDGGLCYVRADQMQMQQALSSDLTVFTFRLAAPQPAQSDEQEQKDEGEETVPESGDAPEPHVDQEPEKQDDAADTASAEKPEAGEEVVLVEKPDRREGSVLMQVLLALLLALLVAGTYWFCLGMFLPA